MSGHGILKYFHPILDKKDPPEGKELYGSNLMTPCSCGLHQLPYFSLQNFKFHNMITKLAITLIS